MLGQRKKALCSVDFATEKAKLCRVRGIGYLISLFADDAGPGVEIIRTITELSIGANQYDMPRVPRWWCGPKIVIGDAAHARLTDLNKAPGPMGRVLRDLVLPLILKRQGKADSQRWIFDHHIEWGARVPLGRAA